MVLTCVCRKLKKKVKKKEQLKYPLGVTLWNRLLSKFISCSFETVALQSIQGREGYAGMAHMQHERNSIQLYHEPQSYFITSLAKALPILTELLPSDNKVSVSVVVLFF